MAASGINHSAVLGAFGLSALIALPLYVINVLVHFAIKVIRPTANSAGIKQLIISLVFFTPMEAALILPAINIFVSGRLLRDNALKSAHPNDTSRVSRVG
ncbi:MAG: hypothetical protein WCC11_07410 [Gammaproteobacteria bacterium]